ncbi:ABC transporter ATP-binding protein [Pseudomonas taetrolens]|uniref:ABC transporter ATP-binding protein n=1 Tax=Pseudomonas taetrolens TaxID=47884 RepID=UPI0030DCD276
MFRNLSLSIPPGKNIGLIGRNGAGKSTLMRLLGAADIPDSGSVVTDKSISWPVGLTGGFQGSMTGRENIKFVCRVYGAVGDDMREKIRYVQEFAEIGDWIDEPIKTYSSGMRSRVAFGLSMAFDFDYYLIDEVMSVGDAQFKRKCVDVFQEKLQQSKVVLVTHNMNEVKKICDIVLLVRNGEIQVYEDVAEGIKAYNS